MKAFLYILFVSLSISCFGQNVMKTCQIKFNKCQLLEAPNLIRGISISKGESVDVIDVIDGYYKINYKGNSGYVSDIFINDTDLQDTLKQRNIKKKEALEKAEQEKIKAEGEKRAMEEIAWKEKMKRIHEEAAARVKREEDERKAKIKSFKDDSVKIENENKKYKAQAKLNKENRNKRLIEKYGTEKAKLIIDRKVYIGMTASEARDSWGNPNDINRTITVNRTHEQWVYSSKKYLYFENGILTTIQD